MSWSDWAWFVGFYFVVPALFIGEGVRRFRKDASGTTAWRRKVVGLGLTLQILSLLCLNASLSYKFHIGGAIGRRSIPLAWFVWPRPWHP